MDWRVPAALWIGWVVAAPAAAAETLAALVAPLLQAQTYCESGSWGFRFPGDQQMTNNTYRVCAHRDGRFRHDTSPGRSEQITVWSDGRMLHRYFPYGHAYQAHDVRRPEADNNYRNPQVSSPMLHSRLLRELASGGLERVGDDLAAYRENPELSDARHRVFDRSRQEGRGLSRVIVVDGAIRRIESHFDGKLGNYSEAASIEVNRPLTDADLVFDLPLWVRVSPQNDMRAFVGILAVTLSLLALGLWTRGFLRAEDPFDLVRFRAGIWRVYRWAFALVAGGLGLLTALTWGGSGHPPAIAYVMVMAFFAAVGFGLLACTLLVSYPAQAIANRLRSAR